MRALELFLIIAGYVAFVLFTLYAALFDSPDYFLGSFVGITIGTAVLIDYNKNKKK